jgi:general stress protein 26
MNHFEEAVALMKDMYGHDMPMSLATAADDLVTVRVVDCFYDDGCFYCTTYGLSTKARQIAKNPHVSLCKDLFQCSGLAQNLGNPLEPQNAQIRNAVRQAFIGWYDKHAGENDPHACILKIRLTKAVLFGKTAKYVIDFDNRIAEKIAFVSDIVF